MNHIIYKYEIGPANNFTVAVPRNAIIRKIGFEEKGLFVWAEVVPDVGKELRKFNVYATGESIPGDKNQEFIDTVFDGAFVWHVYEDTEL